MPRKNHPEENLWLERVTKVSITLLLFSAFRAPDSMPQLAPLVVLLKAGIRFFVLSALCFVLIQAGAQTQRLRVSPWFLCLFLFCGWAIASTAWSPLKSESLGQAASLATLSLLSLAISIGQKSEADAKRLLWWTLQNLFAICLILLLLGLLVPTTGFMTREGQGLGHSTNSGSTASLGMAMVVLAVCLWGGRRRLLTWISFGVVFLLVALFAANRMSMLIAALIIPITIGLYGGRRMIGAALVTTACLGVLYPIVDPRFKLFAGAYESLNRGQSSEEIGSLSGRQAMWEAIWNSYLDSPIIGHGYFVSSAKGVIEVWFLDGELLPVNWTAHNVWLQALVGTGLIGLLLFAAGILPVFIWSAIKPLWGLQRTTVDKFAGTLVLWYALWSLLNESILGPIQPECVVFFVAFGILIANHVRQAKWASALAVGDDRNPGQSRVWQQNRGALQF